MQQALQPPCCPTGAVDLSPRTRRSYLQRPRERGWNKPLLRLAFGSCSDVAVHSQLTVEQAQAAVLRAMATWNEITRRLGLELAPGPADQADILVTWKFAHADADGMLNWQTQAHADFPPGNSLFGPPPLPIHFNADFLWGLETAGCFDVETIALHELAHCLGLVYHSGVDTIMYGAIGQAPFFVRHQIDPETLARMQQLYGAPGFVS